MSIERKPTERIVAIQKGSKAMFNRMIDDAQNRMASFVRGRILKHVRPLFIKKGEDNFTALGTGVLIREGNNYFLASAAHVFDDFAVEKQKCEPYELATFGQGQTVILNEKPICTPRAPDDPGRKRDHIDLGVLKLSAENVAQIGKDRFIGPDHLDSSDRGSYRSLYCALAYPAKWNNASVPAGPNSEPIKPSPLVYGLNKSDPKDYVAHTLSDEENIFVRFQKKRSTDSSGNRIIAPDPYGMSGGGLWHFRCYDPIGAVDGPIPDFRLVGILIEWKKSPEGLLVTRIGKLLALIASEFSIQRPGA